MSKLLVIPNQIAEIPELLELDLAGFILGVKGLSIFVNNELTLTQLKPFVTKIKAKNQEIFIALNKVMYNQDLKYVEKCLIGLEELEVTGILFDDISILNISQRLGLKTPLGWFSEHLGTNYRTCNYWHKQGVKYIGLSNELSLKAILKIREHTTMPLLIRGYGYLPMAYSSRQLLSNYFNYIEQKRANDCYQMYEKVSKELYPICEEKEGTYILSSSLLNIILELPTLVNHKLDYIILSGFGLKHKSFVQVCTCYKEALANIDNKAKLVQLELKVKQLSDNKTNDGFLAKETIYKVRSYE